MSEKAKRTLELHPLLETNQDIANVKISFDSDDFSPEAILVATERLRSSLRKLGINGVPLRLQIEERREYSALGAKTLRESNREQTLGHRVTIVNNEVFLTIAFDNGQFDSVEQLTDFLNQQLRRALLEVPFVSIKETWKQGWADENAKLAYFTDPIFWVANAYRYVLALTPTNIFIPEAEINPEP